MRRRIGDEPLDCGSLLPPSVCGSLLPGEKVDRQIRILEPKGLIVGEPHAPRNHLAKRPQRAAIGEKRQQAAAVQVTFSLRHPNF